MPIDEAETEAGAGGSSSRGGSSTAATESWTAEEEGEEEEEGAGGGSSRRGSRGSAGVHLVVGVLCGKLQVRGGGAGCGMTGRSVMASKA